MSSKIYLYGDSIIDNGSYVNGPDVTAQLQALMPDYHIFKWAEDGAVTKDVSHYQFGLSTHDYDLKRDDRIVISAGGNDALRMEHMLDASVSKVSDAFDLCSPALEQFQSDYQEMIYELSQIGVNSLHNVRVFTIYNKIPTMPRSAMLALSLFNDIITEEAFKAGIKVIDLRTVCADPRCYSDISIIEPSIFGGDLITKAIAKSFNFKF